MGSLVCGSLRLEASREGATSVLLSGGRNGCGLVFDHYLWDVSGSGCCLGGRVSEGAQRRELLRSGVFRKLPKRAFKLEDILEE